MSETSSQQSEDSQSEAGRHAPVRRIARNGAVTLLASSVQTLMMIFVIGLLARALEKSELGLYFTVLVVAVVLQLVLEAGVGSIITLRISQTPERWRQIASEAAGILLLVLAGTIGLPLLAGYGWSQWSGQSLPMGLAVAVAVASAGMQIQQFCFGMFRAFERFEFEGLSKIIQSATLLTLTWMFVVGSEATVFTAASCLAGSYLAGALFCLAIIFAKWPVVRVALGSKILKSWFSQAVPLGIGIIFRRLTLQMGHLLLAVLQPPAMLGLYNVALRPLGPLNLLPQALASASFPMMARNALGNPGAFREAFNTCLRLLVIVAIPVTAAMWLLAEPIVVLLGGESYSEAAAPMRILATILLFSFPTALFRFALTAVNKQSLYTKLVLTTLLFQIALETALILAIGTMGACYGFLVGEALFFGMGIVACRRLGLIDAWWPGVVRAIPAGVLLALALWACQSLGLLQQLAAVGISTIAYFGISVLLGAIKLEEMKTLLAALSRRRKNGGARTNFEPLQAVK